MIYGDPFCFAIQLDMVETWNERDLFWKNGIFHLYIDGELIFSIVDIFELTTIFGFFSTIPVTSLCVNDLTIAAKDLYLNAENYYYGESDTVIEGLYDMTCTAMGDNLLHLYFIKTSVGDRLVWSVNNGQDVTEKILPAGAIENMVNTLHKVSFWLCTPMQYRNL